MADDQGSLISRLMVMCVGGVVALLGLYTPGSSASGRSARNDSWSIFDSLPGLDGFSSKSNTFTSKAERDDDEGLVSSLSWKERLARVFSHPARPETSTPGREEQRARLASPIESPLEELDDIDEPAPKMVGKTRAQRKARNAELLARDAHKDTLTAEDRRELDNLLGKFVK